MIFYLLNRDRPSWLCDVTREALNFQLSFLIYVFGCIILVFVLIGLLLLPVVGLLMIIFLIIGAVAIAGRSRPVFAVDHASSTMVGRGGFGGVRVGKRTGSMATARWSGGIQPNLNTRGGGDIQRLVGTQDVANTLQESACHGGQ